MTELQGNYTVEQVMEITIKDLYAINVPVELTEQVAMPISICIGHIKQCLQALRECAEKEKEKAESAQTNNVPEQNEAGGENNG